MPTSTAAARFRTDTKNMIKLKGKYYLPGDPGYEEALKNPEHKKSLPARLKTTATSARSATALPASNTVSASALTTRTSTSRSSARASAAARYGVRARLPSPDTIAVTAPSPRLSHRTTGQKATPTHSIPRPTIWGSPTRASTC